MFCINKNYKYDSTQIIISTCKVPRLAFCIAFNALLGTLILYPFARRKSQSHSPFQLLANAYSGSQWCWLNQFVSDILMKDQIEFQFSDFSLAKFHLLCAFGERTSGQEISPFCQICLPAFLISKQNFRIQIEFNTFLVNIM